MNLLAGKECRRRCRGWTWGHSRGGEAGTDGDCSVDTHTLSCVEEISAKMLLWKVFLNLFPTPQLPNIRSLLEIYPPVFYKVQSFELLQDKIQLYLSPDPPATQVNPVWSCFIYPVIIYPIIQKSSWISLTGADFDGVESRRRGYNRMRTPWMVNSDPYPVFVQVGILDSIWDLKKKRRRRRTEAFLSAWE